MEDIRKIASQFEAVKVALTQDKNGHILRLSVHPNDTPEDIMRDHVGQRYMVAIVRMNDEGEPVRSEADQEGAAAVKLAATLCADQSFQGWLCIEGLADEASEEAAALAVRSYLGVTSRSELKTNAKAKEKMQRLRNDFVASFRKR